jgi:predicted thioredoxin/glutaredoxin
LLKRINISLFGKKLRITKIDISIAKYNDIIVKKNVLSVPTIIIGNKKLVSSSIEETDVVDAILQCFLKSVSLSGE